MNLIAVGIVALNIAIALIMYYALQGRVEIPMMVGVLCGAVTNTPGLGAANEALSQLDYSGPEIAMGYACAYPLGVIGIILSMIVIRYICRVDMGKEAADIQRGEEANPHLKPFIVSLEVQNEALVGKNLSQVQKFLARDFVCSRIIQDGEIHIPSITRKELFKSGIKIGGDMMGTMSNTLILAFTGGALSTLIVFYAYDMPFLQIFNSYDIGIEIIQGISGSIGVILTVPFVSIIAAFLMTKKLKT